MKKRKKSIFEYILFPLLVVMIVQGLFSLITFQYAGTRKMLHNNSVSILKQTSDNRKIQLENFMTSGWSNVSQQEQGIEEGLGEFLEQYHITIEQFLQDKEYQRTFLIQVTPTIINGIRNNGVTGAFLILSDGDEKKEKENREGIYFRDSDPDKNPSDYTDLALLRGRAEIGREYQIPLDSMWSGKFQFPDLDSNQSAFYWNPLSLAKDNLEAKFSDLGYWSAPFYLNDNFVMDAYKQMSYSIPLIYNGTIYGVYGTEMEMGHICEKLPIKEIDFGQCGSYALVEYSQKEQMNVLLESGNLISLLNLPNNSFAMEDTKYEGLSRIEGTNLYGVINEFNLYNRNSPFADKKLAIVAVTTEEKLFGMGDDLLKRFVIVIFSSLLFGVICIYFVARKTTTPIRIMAEFIRNSKSNELRYFYNTKVKEIDELYEVICNLTERQLETEAELKSEKERYIAALESSTDVIFEYSVQEDIFCQYTFAKAEEEGKKNGYIDKKEYKFARQELRNQEYLNQDDSKRLDEFFRGRAENNVVCFCIRKGEIEAEYMWFELRGKMICDECDVPQKIIGSMRNVTKEFIKRKETEIMKNHDQITGLLNLGAGKRELLEWQNEGKVYQVLVIDIDRFGQFNEHYGIVFGNMVLEEVGESICRLLQENDLAIRCGADQILVTLPERTLEETLSFCQGLNKSLKELNLRANIEISISIGIVAYQVGSIEFDEMLHRACVSMQYAKHTEACRYKYHEKTKEMKVSVYEELTEEDKQKYDYTSGDLREIMGIEYGKAVSLSTIVFTVFDKSNDVASVMPFLLGKIAKAFRCSAVIISMVDYDFCTNRIYYQWHSKIENIPEKNVCKSTVDQFKAAITCIENGKVAFQNLNQKEEGNFTKFRNFFFIEEEDCGVCFSMFENESFVGAITFIQEPNQEKWVENHYEQMQGIVNIIRTNISKNKLDIASKAKSEFLSRMSHEIRTPMNAILGMCNIALQQEEVSPRVQDCLHKINSSSEYLLSLINDILDMSKIESGKLTLEHSPFDLVDLINGVELLIRSQAEQKKIEFTVSKWLQDTVLIGDSLRLNQIMINLLSNALKFTQEGGIIEFTAEQLVQEEECVGIRFGVKDNGIGISKAQEDRVFQAFEQAEEGTARVYGGTGLGLSICKSLVQMMGGELKLNSEMGEGSDFFFVLMFKKSVQTVAKNETIKELPKNNLDFTGKRVLLVEDIELNIEIAKTILELCHFVVEVANNGKVATEMFERSECGYYDVILMDVRMPVMDGLEATRIIRKMGRADAMTIPIVAMTANAFDEDMKKSIDSGMNGHLTKPIDMDKFYKMLSEILGD